MSRFEVVGAAIGAVMLVGVYKINKAIWSKVTETT